VLVRVRVLVALLRVRVQAKQLMRFGATGAAIAELTGVQQWCCVSSELGSECLLELAMAHVANDDDAAAKPVLSKLQSKAPSTQIRRAAQQMLFQETAQAFMKTGSDAANAEFAKLGRAGLKGSLAVAYDKRYDTSAAYLTSSKRPPVASLSEARMALRSAAVRRDDAGAPQRITQALAYIASLPSAERLPPTSEPSAATSDAPSTQPADGTASAAALLRGEWLLGLTCSGSSIAFAPSDASLHMAADGTYESLTPRPIGLVKASGTFVLRGAASASGGALSELSLALEPSACFLGPLPLPTIGQGDALAVRLLDTLMCVTQTAGGAYAVYVRPSMRAPAEDE